MRIPPRILASSCRNQPGTTTTPAIAIAHRCISSTVPRNAKFEYTISEAYLAKKRTAHPPTPPLLRQLKKNTTTTPSSPPGQASSARPPPVELGLPEVQNPRKLTRPNSGEDSFFYTATDHAPRGVAVGVADGVGGWTEIGVDPSAFSQALCDEMHQLFTNYLIETAPEPAATTSTSTDGIASLAPAPYNPSSTQLPSPRALLEKAYQNVIDQAQIAAGGSTACVAVLSTSTGTLHAANLGDSGFAVFRAGAIACQSQPQVHAFNTPFQLAVLPPALSDFEANLPKSASKHIRDSPRDAVTSSFQLRQGDVVVLATDGFWDNVGTGEALQMVTDAMVRQQVWARLPATTTDKQEFTPSLHSHLSATAAGALAAQLVKAARTAALDPNKVTPFALEVQREMRIQYKGGKPDDITILVIYVSQKLPPSL